MASFSRPLKRAEDSVGNRERKKASSAFFGKAKTPIFFFLAFLIQTLILLGILELATHLLTRAGILPPATTWSYRLAQPSPYKDAPYFSRAFVHESQIQPGGWTTPDGTRLVLPNDFTGTWFNVRDHKRATTGQPKSFQHTVYVFGGSTVYSSEVPDDFTIPSQLQKLLNEQQPDTWKVENLGASTVTASQELERLKTTAPVSGDVVIFYDGVNDVIQGVYYNNPTGWIVHSNRERFKNLEPSRALLLRLDLWLRDHTAIYPQIRPVHSAAPAHLANATQALAIAEPTATQYAAALTAAAGYAHAHGALFIHALQPNIFTKSAPSDEEQTLRANPVLVLPGMDKAFAAAYPALQHVTANLQPDDVVHLDLTTAFDNLHDVYLDFCHVAHVGNAAVARFLVPAVLAISARKS
jgi:hypothetical protein